MTKAADTDSASVFPRPIKTTVAVRMREDGLAQIDTLAREFHVNRSEMIRLLIVAGLPHICRPHGVEL